jgi:NAD(P)-dependent dehydrogenase (short-subunit alcohol dehydrogenase family)
MSKLDVVAARNKELVKSQPITAVFAGGTSGIGEYALRALASTNGSSGQGLRVYIVARNQSSANAVISDCQSVCPAGEFYFVHSTDLSLLREVDRVCAKIIQSEQAHSKKHPASIDLLVMTQAHFAFGSKLARKGSRNVSLYK